MEAAIAAVDAKPRGDRIRLIALAFASWHDHLPVPTSKPRGEPGRGEHARRATYTLRENEALTLRLERERDDALVGAADDRNVSSIVDHMRRKAGPFWRALEDAYTVAQVEEPFGCRLIVEVLIDPWDARTAAVRAHALPHIAGGPYGTPVETPRYRLLRALVLVDRHLPEVRFPAEVVEQTQGWEEWLAAIRPRKTQSGKTVRSGADMQALRQRDRYVRELAQLAGWPQRRIATQLGLNQSTVARILQRVVE